jgi:hypothetical protein
MRNWKNIKYSLIILAIGLLYLAACDTDSCLHGTGEKTSVKIETGYFGTLKVQGIFRMILVRDTTCFVEFEGGSKVLQYVSAENSESTLWLNNTNRCSFFRDYEKVIAYVHFRHLNKIDLYEVCKVESQGAIDSLDFITVQGPMAEINIVFNTNHFNFYNNRTTGGLYTFSGICDRFRLSGYYIAKINTDSLVARDMYVNNSSLSDIYVDATELLTVQLLNRGNIYYKGSPQIVIDSISGSGRLLPWITVGE